MEKKILIQYADLQKEIKDLDKRIYDTQERIKKMEEKGYVVKDFVKGTRKDGTFGNIAITGFPYPEYSKQKTLLQGRKIMMNQKLDELLEMINRVEEYIETIEDSRMRRIFRYRYIDNLNWIQVSFKMGQSHTADSCRMAHNNFMNLEKK